MKWKEKESIGKVSEAFVFTSGYFVPIEWICNKDFSYKDFKSGGGTTVRTLCNLVFVL